MEGNGAGFKVLSREFGILSWEFKKGQASCEKKWSLRGNLVTNLPEDPKELRSVLLEKGSPWNTLELSDEQLVRETRKVFHQMDLHFLVSGSGYVVCKSQNFQSPLLGISGVTPVLSEYTYPYWYNGEGGSPDTQWMAAEPMKLAIFRTLEGVFWNRKGYRFKAGESLDTQQVSGFERTRVLLAHGEIEFDGVKYQSPQVFEVNGKHKIKSTQDNTLFAVAWI